MQRPVRSPDAFASHSIPAFSPFVDPIAGYVAEIPAPVIIAAGVLLIHQEQRPAFVGLIRSGIVKLSFGNDEGEDVTLGLRSEGWWMNANIALLGVPSLCSITTVTECAISKITTEKFSEKVADIPPLIKHLLFTQCRELLMLKQYTIMRGRSASERLRYLLGEGSQSIWEIADPTQVLRQSDIAELLGITPEHLSRVRNLGARSKSPTKRVSPSTDTASPSTH